MRERGDGDRHRLESGSARGADPDPGDPDPTGLPPADRLLSATLPATIPVAPLDRFPDLTCVHSERAGGASQGRFGSLNLGLLTSDDPEHVRENRRRWFRACGFAPERVISPLQVHGSSCIRVTSADAGRGALDLTEALRADALWTDEAGLALVAVSADCPLVALYEPERRVAAIVHAGWRGAAAGIAAHAVRALAEAGARPERIWAGVGPSIGACCYPVGRDVASPLLARVPEGPWIARDGDRYRVDLAGFIAADLAAAGLRTEHIARSRRCTACDADRLYSHRRDGEGSGRIGLLIAMRPPSGGAGFSAGS